MIILAISASNSGSSLPLSVAIDKALSIATDKGNDDPELDAEIARIITEMQKDYTLTTLSMKWFKNADGSSNDYTVAF